MRILISIYLFKITATRLQNAKQYSYMVLSTPPPFSISEKFQQEPAVTGSYGAIVSLGLAQEAFWLGSLESREAALKGSAPALNHETRYMSFIALVPSTRGKRLVFSSSGVEVGDLRTPRATLKPPLALHPLNKEPDSYVCDTCNSFFFLIITSKHCLGISFGLTTPSEDDSVV